MDHTEQPLGWRWLIITSITIAFLFIHSAAIMVFLGCYLINHPIDYSRAVTVMAGVMAFMGWSRLMSEWLNEDMQ